MSELSKTAQTVVDLVGARDERDRLFNRLRNPRLTDDEKSSTLEEFAKAEAAYRQQLDSATKKKGA